VKTWLVMVMLLGFVVESVQGHGLSLDWQVRSNRVYLQAEMEGDTAGGADVEVRSESGELVAEGHLDERGAWDFPISGTNGLTVVVDAGLGHRRTLTLSRAQLFGVESADQGSSRPGGDGVGVVAPAKGETFSGRASGRTDGTSDGVGRVLLGVTFLLAAGAAWMSWRNSQRVGELERRLGPR